MKPPCPKKRNVECGYLSLTPNCSCFETHCRSLQMNLPCRTLKSVSVFREIHRLRFSYFPQDPEIYWRGYLKHQLEIWAVRAPGDDSHRNMRRDIHISSDVDKERIPNQPWELKTITALNTKSKKTASCWLKTETPNAGNKEKEKKNRKPQKK